MNLKALRLFRLTVLHGSLSSAASAANLSQPAASRLISTLEHQLKLTLFERGHQQLQLTVEGERFFGEAEHILHGIEEIPAIARDINLKAFKSLRIITSAPIGATLLPPVIDALRRAQPTLKIRIDIGRRFDVETQVGSKRYNLGLLSLPVHNAIVELNLQPFMAARTEVLLPAAHALANCNSIDAHDLVNEPFVSLGSGQIWRTQLEQVMAGIGATPYIALEVGSSILVPEFVARGYGLGLVDRGCWPEIHDDRLVLRPLAQSRWLTYAAVLPPDRHRPITGCFVKALRDYVGQRRATDPMFAENVSLLMD